MFHFRANIADKVGRFLISSHFTFEFLKIVTKSPDSPGASDAKGSKMQILVRIKDVLNLFITHGLALGFQPEMLQIASESTGHVRLQLAGPRDGKESFNLFTGDSDRYLIGSVISIKINLLQIPGSIISSPLHC